MKNFIPKPVLTIIVLIFIVGAIIYLQAGKTKIDNKQIFSNTNQAPEIAGTQKWINSEPLTLESLRGKVVLIDFWTYTCINCIRTLPYLKDWDKKYRNDGLVIIGVHSPEFEFEKKYENVLSAIKKYEIKYPVVQDNDFSIWRAYNNRFWPHEFLIDIDGNIREDHAGEGSYDETEKKIQELLNERMKRLNQKKSINEEIKNPETAVGVDFSKINSPEIYLGYKFYRGNFGSSEIIPEQTVDYKIPSNIEINNVYLEGKWKNNADNMELVSEEGSIVLKFDAKNVNIVAGSEKGSEASILLDNNYVNDKNKGSDANDKSMAAINNERLYSLVNTEDYGQHSLKINIKESGFKIYTFTFG